MSVKSRKKEYSEATRAALVEGARSLFAEKGYANTAIEEVARSARVTRGALYHHFGSKRDLFVAVFEQSERDQLQRVDAAVAAETDPWNRTLSAVRAYLDSCLDPAIQRSVLHEAVTVLGRETWREIESRYGLRITERMLHGLVEAGVFPPYRIDLLADIFLAVFMEAGMLIAQSDDPEAARVEIGRIIEHMINGLRFEPL